MPYLCTRKQIKVYMGSDPYSANNLEIYMKGL